MEGAKQMLEGKLQDAGVQLMECERQLAEALGGGGGSAGRSPKAGASGRVSRHDSAAQVCARREAKRIPRLAAPPTALDSRSLGSMGRVNHAIAHHDPADGVSL